MPAILPSSARNRAAQEALVGVKNSELRGGQDAYRARSAGCGWQVSARGGSTGTAGPASRPAPRWARSRRRALSAEWPGPGCAAELPAGVRGDRIVSPRRPCGCAPRPGQGACARRVPQGRDRGETVRHRGDAVLRGRPEAPRPERPCTRAGPGRARPNRQQREGGLGRAAESGPSRRGVLRPHPERCRRAPVGAQRWRAPSAVSATAMSAARSGFTVPMTRRPCIVMTR